MPKFGLLHDDAILFTSAKSLATGEGYRIPSLPEKPFQTKFPPLYPLYLSAIWKLNPQFPANLPLATLFCSVLLIPYLALAWMFFRRSGSGRNRAFLLLALLAVNPYLIFFGATTFSDVFFTCWVLLALLASDSKSAGMAFVAGLAAACAYLSRTAGIALLVSIPICYYRDRSWRRAGAFLTGMLPLGIWWTLWTRSHVLPTNDPALFFYTDYLKFQTMNVGFDNVIPVVWKNFGWLVLAMGHLVLPRLFATPLENILSAAIAVAMVAGVVRLARHGIARSYALFALVSAAVLLVSGFPSTERYMLPLYPLLLVGLVTEWERLSQAIVKDSRVRDTAQRIAAHVWAVGLALLTAAVLLFQLYVTFWFLPSLAAGDRAQLRDRRAAYAWMIQNLPPSAKVLSSEDPLLYLYTGLSGNSFPLSVRDWYNGDHAAIVDAYRNVAAYCRRRGLQYFYSTSDDLARWTEDRDIQQVLQVIRDNPELTPVFTAGFGTIYRVHPHDE